MGAMGDAMDRGLVLTLSIWDDGATEMRWLDSNFPTTEDPTSRYGVARGPCSSSDSSPLNLRSKYPGASVSYTNIRSGRSGPRSARPGGWTCTSEFSKGQRRKGRIWLVMTDASLFSKPCKSWNSQPPA